MTLDISELQQENERLNTQPGGDFLANFVRMPDGNGVVTMRFLPPAAPGMFDREKNPFFQSTRVHKLKGRNYQCLKQLVDGKWVGECPVCRYYNYLWQESEKQAPDLQKATQNKARAIKPIERYYYNTIVRTQVNPSTNEVETNVGPKIYSCGKTVHKMIIRAIVGDKEMDEKPLGDITDIKNGRDFKLIKTMRQSGRESYPNYSDSKFLEVSPLGDPDQVKEWLANLHDLVSLRENGLLSHDDLKHQLKVHLGLEEEEETNFDPTEYEPGDDDGDSAPTVEVTEPAPQKETVKAAKTETTAAEIADDGPAESAGLTEEDFMSTIQNIDIS